MMPTPSPKHPPGDTPAPGSVGSSSATGGGGGGGAHGPAPTISRQNSGLGGSNKTNPTANPEARIHTLPQTFDHVEAVETIRAQTEAMTQSLATLMKVAASRSHQATQVAHADRPSGSAEPKPVADLETALQTFVDDSQELERMARETMERNATTIAVLEQFGGQLRATNSGAELGGGDDAFGDSIGLPKQHGGGENTQRSVGRVIANAKRLHDTMTHFARAMDASSEDSIGRDDLSLK